MRCPDVCLTTGCSKFEIKDKELYRCRDMYNEQFGEKSVYEKRVVPMDCPHPALHKAHWNDAEIRVIKLRDELDRSIYAEERIIMDVFLQLIINSCGGKRSARTALPQEVDIEYLKDIKTPITMLLWPLGMRGFYSWDEFEIKFSTASGI
jgi:hypothetical protein